MTTRWSWSERIWAVKATKTWTTTKLPRRESTARHQLVQPSNGSRNLHHRKTRRGWRSWKSIWNMMSRGCRSTHPRDIISCWTKRSTNTRICSRTTQRCGHGSTQTVSNLDAISNSRRNQLDSVSANHFPNFTLWLSASRWWMLHNFLFALEGSFVRWFVHKLWQMVSSPSPLFIYSTFVGAWCGFKYFRIVGTWNRFRWKKLLKEQISVSTYTIVPLCGTVSMLHYWSQLIVRFYCPFDCNCPTNICIIFPHCFGDAHGTNFGNQIPIVWCNRIWWLSQMFSGLNSIRKR